MNAMAPIEYTIRINNLDIAIKEWGDANAKPLIALHGWLDNAASFDRLAPALGNYRVIALDLPGHGFSSHRPKGCRYHLIDNLDEVVGLADALKLQQFTLLGHSMGAGIATLLAGTFPERVEQLILIEGIGTQTSSEADAPYIAAKAVTGNHANKPQTSSMFPSRDMAIQARTLSFGGISEHAARSLSERGLSESAQGFYWHADPQLKADSIMRLSEAMIESYLERIVMPVTLILGENSFFAGWEALSKRSQRLKQGSVIRLPGNHHLHLEPDTSAAVATAVNKVLLVKE